MPALSQCHVAIIGGGPAGLMAAEVVSAGSVRVTVYDRMPSLGRKLLMAGRGGLNLTHSEPLDTFMQRYRDRAALLRPAIAAFPPEAVRAWCERLGQPTFVGTSGRVYPRSMKSSPLLRAWLRRLGEQGVEVRTRHTWRGMDDAGHHRFETPEGAATIAADATVLALGGGSWPTLGSDAGWVQDLKAAGIALAPVVPSNCGFRIDWSPVLRERFVGQPLKRVALRHGDRTVHGEAMITETGIEGGAVYSLSPELRETIAARGVATLSIDLRPETALSELARQLAMPRGKQSLATFLRRARLSPVAIGLLQEWAHGAGRPLASMSPDALAALAKALPLKTRSTAPINRAISTAGGITFEALGADFRLLSRPGIFAAGEMLDWEAPTGGYLLQACFATGAAAGRGVLEWLAARPA